MCVRMIMESQEEMMPFRVVSSVAFGMRQKSVKLRYSWHVVVQVPSWMHHRKSFYYPNMVLGLHFTYTHLYVYLTLAHMYIYIFIFIRVCMYKVRKGRGFFRRDAGGQMYKRCPPIERHPHIRIRMKPVTFHTLYYIRTANVIIILQLKKRSLI